MTRTYKGLLLLLLAFSVSSLSGEQAKAKEWVILSNGIATQEELSLFLTSHNPSISETYARRIAGLYRRESETERINSDLAFIQMCLETGFLQFGGSVESDQNNFCGLGAVHSEDPGLSFPSPEEGIRAHIQHLKAYACDQPLIQPLIDPRFSLVRRGSARTAEDLTGLWATDPEYGRKLGDLYRRLLVYTH